MCMHIFVSRVMNCTLDTVKNISNHFSLLLQDKSLFFFSSNFSNLLTELNEITSALLRFHYREGHQKKNISINPNCKTV